MTNASSAQRLELYFDFVSPFSYFAVERLERDANDVGVTLVPVLFAGLLKHWQHKGPAEIPSKRRFTMRYVQWLATRHDIPFKVPPAHPFNPLGALRLALALGGEPDAIRAIFRFIWQEGRRPDNPEDWRTLVERLNVEDADARIGRPDVKEALRQNGERALALGLFGVPTFVVRSELFWGFDALPFALEYARDPTVLENAEMRRLTDLPIGAVRDL